MMNVKMKKFGSTLTDRADGKKAVKDVLEKHSLPVVLDFSGVIALGSSFGEEVVLKIAKMQDNNINILNVNRVIKNSLLRIVEGTDINLTFD